MAGILPLTIAMLGLGTGVQASLDPEGALRNPGFESASTIDGWSIMVYGPRARVETDTAIAREGRQSLRVSASEPSDAALGQEVTLRPRGWYRFIGWVRTMGIDPGDAPVFGTFQVQRAGGHGTLAAGPAHRGDTDWTKVQLVFQAPADGRVRIAPVPGRVRQGDRHGLVRRPAARSVRPIEGDRRHHASAPPIGPDRAGASTASSSSTSATWCPGCGPTSSATAASRGSARTTARLPQGDRLPRAALVSRGATNRGKFDRDTSTKIGGSSLLPDRRRGRRPCTLGIAQDGIAVQAGVACDFSVLPQAERDPAARCASAFTARGPFTPSASSSRPANGRSTGPGSFRRPPIDQATISIEFHGPGTLWLDSARLMPEDAIGGWRADVVEAVRR